MKTLQQLVTEKRELDVQDGGVNYISVSDLEKYKTIAKNFLSPESIKIIDYMIRNNDTYVETLSGGDKSDNCLCIFYSNPSPKTQELSELYKALGVLQRNGRLLEIPTFQTKEQFKTILSGAEPPDAIIMDLTSEKGRNDCAKRYMPMVHKMTRQFLGKLDMTYEEILSAAMIGLTYAMGSYGKKQREYKDEAEEKRLKSYTFAQYAAFAIRYAILGDAKSVGHGVVRVPISVQNKERHEQGSNHKTNSISGDAPIGDDEKSKALFDYIGGPGSDTPERSMDRKDLDMLWGELFKMLEKKFDKNVIESWYLFNGLNGRPKTKNKDIAAKLKVTTANITYYCNTVNNALRKDKALFKKMQDIYDLMKECRLDSDHDNDIVEEGFHGANISDDFD